MARIVTLIVAATVVVVTGVTPSTAQDKPAMDKKMAEMMKNTEPGEQHKLLDMFVGNWDIVVRFRYGGGPEREGKAASAAKWILDGRFIQQDFTSQIGQVTLQFVGFDNQKKKFFEVKMDNRDTGVLYTEGTASADGKTITNVGIRTDPMTGETNKLRTVTTIGDRDHYTVEWFLTGKDGKEEKTVTMIHTRRR